MAVRRRTPRILLIGLALSMSPVVVLASAPPSAGGAIRAGRVPAAVLPYQDPSLTAAQRTEDLLARMTLNEKIGQMTQAERLVLKPGALSQLGVGSVLSGGGSAPSPNTATSWADMYDGFQREALSSRLAIPMIYGIDAVHGHNNVRGATLFPHNIGLGATRNPALVHDIGRAVAEEVAGTGIDWDFAPCLCVARNDRWGRTYESFGEDTSRVSDMTTFVDGLQGARLSDRGSVLATAKHFIGDGGTAGGVDQGDTRMSEAELRTRFLPPFVRAIQRGVGTVMISYSSFNGLKMHANAHLVNDVLKGELGFTGFVVSDWEGVDQIDGQGDFTQAEVATAINAGIDMVMVPDDYERFISYVRQAVDDGQIPMARIDDANRRILTKKFELGLFEHPFTDRSLTSTVGSTAHRELARRAVQQSQVVLKNKYGVLPLPRTAAKIFVAGKSADNIGYQSGGWSIEWQGDSGAITPGTSILDGIRQTVSPGTQVTYDRYGQGIDDSYNAAIVAVGETPYAEFKGDRPGSMDLDAEDLQTIARLQAAGVPVVVVLVSGRPLDVHEHLADWDALVASWLPGTEGRGVADVLFGAIPATGTLPVTWMRDESQQPINVGDGQDPLFPFGFGLHYAARQSAYDYIGAVYYDAQQGTRAERCADLGCGQALAYLAAGDHAMYAGVDFGAGSPTALDLRLSSGAAATGTVEVRLDSPTGPAIGAVEVANTGGWQSWRTARLPLSGRTSGVHDVYLVMGGAGGQDFVNLNWLKFTRD